MVSSSGKKLCFDLTGQTYPWLIERWIVEIYSTRTCIIDLSIWKKHTVTPWDRQQSGYTVHVLRLKQFSFCSRSRSRNQTFKPFSPINLLLNDETSQLTTNNLSCSWILSNKRLRFISVSKKTNFKFSVTAQIVQTHCRHIFRRGRGIKKATSHK